VFPELVIFFSGTTLHFANTVGMLVKGELYAVGRTNQEISMRRLYDNTTVYPNITELRLVGGESELEGVLEINTTDGFATVCNKVRGQGGCPFAERMVCP